MEQKETSVSYLFLIRTLRINEFEPERPFQISVANPTLNKLRQVIKNDIIRNSVFEVPLNDSEWNIFYVEKETKLIQITKDNLNDLIKTHSQSKHREFRIQIKFENDQKFQVWKGVQEQQRVPNASINEISPINGKLKLDLKLPSRNMKMYIIQYQVQESGEAANKEYIPPKVAYNSPIFIDNIWPHQYYRIRVRLKSKLFKGKHSMWTQWVNDMRACPGRLTLYQSPSSLSTDNVTTFESFNKQQIIQWIEQKIKLLFLTEFEQKYIFPQFIKTIKHSKFKINGKDLLLKNPSYFVNSLDSIYRKYVLKKNQNDEEKANGAIDITLLRESISNRRKRSKPKGKQQQISTTKKEELLKRQLSDIIQIYNATTTKSVGDAGNLTDYDLLHYLTSEPIQNLAKNRGININEMREILKKSSSSSISLNTKVSTSSTTITRQLNKYTFLSILYRVKKILFKESKLINIECDNPFSIHIYMYFIKQPTKYKYYFYYDKNYVELKQCLFYADCYLYRCTFYLNSNPSTMNLQFHLCEKKNNDNDKPRFLTKSEKDNEDIFIESLHENIIIGKIYNDKKDTINNEKRNDIVTRIKNMKDWSTLSISKGFFNSSDDLQYLDCMLQFILANIGTTLSLSTSINTLNKIWFFHKNSDNQKVVNKSNIMIKKRLKSQRKIIFSSNYEYNSWHNLIQILFLLNYLFGSEELLDISKKINKWFEIDEMKIMTLIQNILNGEYFNGSNPKRIFLLLSCLFNDNNILNDLCKKIITSISKTKHLLLKYQYYVWFEIIKYLIELNGFECEYNYLFNDIKICEKNNESDISSHIIKLIQIDYNLELITNKKRMKPFENQSLMILSKYLNTFKTSSDNQRSQIKEKCFNKMVAIISLFNPNYSTILIDNKQEIKIIIKSQYKPFKKLLLLFDTIRPQNEKDLQQFAILFSEFIENYSPRINDDKTLNNLVELLKTNEIFRNSTPILSAIMFNDKLCTNSKLIQFMVNMFKSNDNKKKYQQRLYEYFDLFWKKYGILLTFELLVIKHGLPKQICFDIFKKYKDRINKTRFEDWLELIVNKEIKDDIKLLLSDNIPIKYKNILDSGDYQLKNKDNKLKIDGLIEILVNADPNLYIDKQDKPLIYYYKYTVCDCIIKNFLSIDSKYINCHDDQFNDLDILQFYYCGYGKYYLQFINKLYKINSTQSSKIPFCSRLLNNFKRWWIKLRIACSKSQLNDNIISQLSETSMYQTINDLYIICNGKPDTDLDIKIDRVFKRYQKTQDIKNSLNIFFNNFVPSNTKIWNQDIKDIHIKKIELENINARDLENFSFSWFNEYKTFFDALLLYPNSSIFKKMFNEITNQYLNKWSNEHGIKWQDCDKITMCLWLESRLWPKQSLISIHKLQSLFLQRKINGKLLFESKITNLNNTANVTNEFIRRLQFDPLQEKEFKPLIGLLMFNCYDAFFWNQLISINIIRLIYQFKVKIMFQNLISGLLNKNLLINDLSTYFLWKPHRIEFDKIKKELIAIKIEKNQTLDKDIYDCLFAKLCLQKARLVMDILDLFQKILISSPNLYEMEVDDEYKLLQDTLIINSNVTISRFLSFWVNHQQKCISFDYKKYPFQWLQILIQNKQFLIELFELFEDDARFQSHLKLFQNPDPQKSIRLNKLSIVRKQFVKDILPKLSRKKFSKGLDFILNRFLKNKMSKIEIERLQSLIEEWDTIKINNERLEAIKFQQDRAQLHRLKSFKFISDTQLHHLELKIELYPQQIDNNLNNEDNDNYEDEPSETSTAIIPTEHINILPHQETFYPELPDTPQRSLNVFISPLSNRVAPYIPRVLSSKILDDDDDDDHKNIDDYNQEIETMTCDKFMSLFDRLLIYTSTATNASYILNKSIEEWNTNDVVQFFKNEIKSSRSIIDERYHSFLIQILSESKITGIGLKLAHYNLKKFEDAIFNEHNMHFVVNLFDDNDPNKELILNELLKIIQTAMMKDMVEDIVPKFEICKKIQQLRTTYYEQGGRDHLPFYDTIHIFEQNYNDYESILEKWKFYYYRWTKMITDLRNQYKVLTYFTVNDMRFIIEQCEDYKLKSQNGTNNISSHLCLSKLNAKFSFIQRNITLNQTYQIISKWDSLDGTIYLFELRNFILNKLYKQQSLKILGSNKSFPMNETMQYATLRNQINTYLELKAFDQHQNNKIYNNTKTLMSITNNITQQLQLMKKDWTLNDTKELLLQVIPFDERRIFGKLGKYLNDEFPINTIVTTPNSPNLSLNDIPSDNNNNNNDHNHNNNNNNNNDIMSVYMAPGRPHLYKVDNPDLIISRIIKCFSGQGAQELNASQILICTSMTTLEEVRCFLYRCCFHSKEIYRSLYCLVEPENLKSNITDEILSNLLNLLREYEAFLAIVTASTKNRWYSDLQIYHEEQEGITEDECRDFYAKYTSPLSISNNNPKCQIFLSNEAGVGKSFEITKLANKNNYCLVHIPFNSSIIDEDFVVDRLSFGEQQLLNNNRKTRKRDLAFHLNISSHAGKDINILLFKLLILRHITKKSNGESFQIKPSDIFLIELPSQISTTYIKTDLEFVKKYFYFIAGNRAFIKEELIKMNIMNFELTEQHHFVGKYLDALDKGLLEITGPKSKKADWDFLQHPKVSKDRLFKLIQKYSTNKLSISYIKTYLDFLYRQFLILASSKILTTNALAVDINKTGMFRKSRFVQYHRILARSFAVLANAMASQNYKIENPFSSHLIAKSMISLSKEDIFDDDDDEEEEKEKVSFDDGNNKSEETFFLIEQWSKADPPISFLNPGLFTSFATPALEKDLLFSGKNAENAFTILCTNLESCSDPDALEWQLVKQTYNVKNNRMNALKFDMFDYNIESKNNESQLNEKQDKAFADTEDKQKEKMRLLLRLCGGYRKFDSKTNEIKPIIDDKQRTRFVNNLYNRNTDYALTFDNILKIAAIFFRVQARIPVLIMGETGCGKTRLLRYMADILSLEMQCVDVHGGYSLNDLQFDINKAKNRAQQLSPRTVLLFLDEINTSSEIASFKEIICDHSFKGNELPINLLVIGALNPYRKRILSKQENDILKQDKKNNKTYYKNDFEKDMSKLVYTVYPLPPSMKRFVWNFGSISKQNEKQYIAVITNHCWNEFSSSFNIKSEEEKECRAKFAHLIYLSQNLLRKWLNEVSVVSLRDVQRCNKFFVWFYKSLADDYKGWTKNRIIRAMTMGLAQCYYYRLNFQLRKKYAMKISLELKSLTLDFNKEIFDKMLLAAQDKYMKKLKIEKGIALNRAFKENIFIMLCGIVTATPTIIVGRPGSSKTLAMSVLESNLLPGSKNEKLTKLNIDDYVVQQFQCSKLTTAEAIEQYWKQCEIAQNYQDASKRILFLDEMGLAEQSQSKPLKILHKLLEEPTISFIGLSNWSLDSAKMNRCILHNVLPIHIDNNDLYKTAQALSKYGPGGEQEIDDKNMNILQSLVKFYKRLIEKQNKYQQWAFNFNFHGARDFYHVISYLKFSLNFCNKEISTKLLIESILRNFNGFTPNQFDKYLIPLIRDTLNLDLNDISLYLTKQKNKIFNTLYLINSNIVQSSIYSKDNNYDMRHILLITNSESTWQYLYDMKILKHNKSRVIFGSKFKNDINSSLHLHENIEKIKNAMSSGHTVVLLHLDELYDSLYDVLNQRYLKSGFKRYSTISIRNETIRVQIHPSFRFIIVVPAVNAHHTSKDENKHTPVAFLNRLEKQYLNINNLYINMKGDRNSNLLFILENQIENIFNTDSFSKVFAGFMPQITFASALIYSQNIILKKYNNNNNTNYYNYSDDESDEEEYDEKKEEEEKAEEFYETTKGGFDDNDNDKNIDDEIIKYAIALLLTNCYLRHFICYQDLDLHQNRMKIINRGRPFESLFDIINYYNTQCDETKNEFISLIRCTTHDHFQHSSDYKKYFKIKTKSYQSLNVNNNDIDNNDDNKDNEINTKKKQNAILINITDIASSREFTSTLNDFLSDLEYNNLIIQTTNNSNDEFLHNLHLQYLIEKVKHFSQNEDGKSIKISKGQQHKQIIVIVYMNRIQEIPQDIDNEKISQFIQSQQYPLIFNNQWKSIYCDAILPSEIKITDLNINDVYTSNIFEKRLEKHTESVIQSTFEMALNHIRFEEKMRFEVDRINKIFSNSNIDRKLKTAVIERVKDVLKSANNGPLDAIKQLLESLDANSRKQTQTELSLSHTPNFITNNTTQHIMSHGGIHLNTNTRITTHNSSNSNFTQTTTTTNSQIMAERGSFRALIIKQISKQMQTELVEVLVAMLNHHSSELYHPYDDEEQNNFDQKNISRQQSKNLFESKGNLLFQSSGNLLDPRNSIQPSRILSNDRILRRFDPKMRKIWLELLKQKKIIVLPHKINRLYSNNRNLQIDVEAKLIVEFPFSPYINSYFHKIRREIETTANKDEYFTNNAQILLHESGHFGQEILLPIIRRHLIKNNLEGILSIKRFIEYWCYDLSVLELKKMFGGLRFNKKYFNSLTKFVQFFILNATHQVHYKFVNEEEEKDNLQNNIENEIDENGNEIEDSEDEDDESEGYVNHEIDDDDDDYDGGMRIGDDDDDDDDDNDDEKDDYTDPESGTDDDDDDESSNSESEQEKEEEKDNDNQIEQQQQKEEKEEKEKEENKMMNDSLKRQQSSIIKFPYLIDETIAAFWCNERLLHELINIMSLLEKRWEKLNEMLLKYWYTFKDNGLLISIYNTLNEILNLINSQFSESSIEAFKSITCAMRDISESITFVLTYLENERYNIKDLINIFNKWDVIRLYLLCYSPFDINDNNIKNDRQIAQIKQSLQKLYNEFEQDSDFATIDKIKFICNLISDLCRILDKSKSETQDIIQYVVQQYICNFAFGTFDIIPDDEDQNGKEVFQKFVFYLIELISKDDINDDKTNNNNINNDDDDDDEENMTLKMFRANSFTKQEIAAKILKLLQIHNADKTIDIRVKLNDALNDSQLLSSVLLRSAESYQHTLWLKKSKKKQIVSEKDIKSIINALSNVSSQEFLNQLRVISKCKVIIFYIVKYLDVRNFNENYIKQFNKLLNLKISTSTKFQSLINGLGFYFFSEFWRQRGSFDACKLRKQKKLIKHLKLLNIFNPKDINIKFEDTIITNSKYKNLDDNIFNLLKHDETEHLQQLQPSKHTIVKLNKTINRSLKRLRSNTMIIMRSNTENIANDQFLKLSTEMYQAIHKNKDMSKDLYLTKIEIIHLIGSIFNSSYLYGGCSSEKVYLWLRNQNIVPTGSRLQHIILQLLNNSFPDSMLILNTKSKKQMSLEEMLRIRLIWHLFGISASIKQNPFWQLIIDPMYYNDGYLIGMNQSQSMNLLKAMSGHNVYICPNKHLYFVADCGKTNQTAICNQCQEIIGNAPKKSKHKIARGNKRIGIVSENGEIIPIKGDNNLNNFSSSLPPEFLNDYKKCIGFSLNIIDKNANDDCVRTLNEIGVIILRSFIISSLIIHHLQRSKQFPSSAMQFIFKNDYNHNNNNNINNNNNNNNKKGNKNQEITKDSLTSILLDRLKKYIKQIKSKLGKSYEETLYILHCILHKIYLTFNTFYSDKNGDNKCKDLASREKFEAYFMNIIESVIQNIDISINNVRSVVSADSFKKYWSKRIDFGFKDKNQSDVEAKKEFITKFSPHLFLPFRHITISDFRTYVINNVDQYKYPVTFGIIECMDTIGLSIFAIKYIPSILNWMKMVHQRLSGRISKKEINQLQDTKTNIYKYNAKWLLDRCKEENLGDEKKFEKALIGFVDGWNHIAKRTTTQKTKHGAKIIKSSQSRKHSLIESSDDDDDDDDSDDSDDEEEKDDKKTNNNDNDNDNETNTKHFITNSALEEYARYIVLTHECSTVPIMPIQDENGKPPKPSNVALNLAINCVDSSFDTSLMIQGILDHLVAANRTVLDKCINNNKYDGNGNDGNGDDGGIEELFNQTHDFIDIQHISRNTDVVDFDESELLQIIQSTTQQSLEYGEQSSFGINIPLLESKLFNRYIISRKQINYQKHRLCPFVFAGHNNIKSYIDRINHQYLTKNNNINNEELYFEEISKDVKDLIKLKITLKCDFAAKNHKTDNDKKRYHLQIISSAKQGIEQTLIGISRWSQLPQKNILITLFMKDNLKLFQDEYELFDDINNSGNNKLYLKHCHGIWKLLDKLYSLNEGKWLETPSNLPIIYTKKIRDQQWIKSLKYFVNSFDKDLMWQFITDWRDFMERILCNDDIIKHANITSLISYLKYSELNPILIERFPEEIKLENAADSYSIAVQQFHAIIKQ